MFFALLFFMLRFKGINFYCNRPKNEVIFSKQIAKASPQTSFLAVRKAELTTSNKN